MSKPAFTIETDLSYSWQDAGPWRSFSLYTEGNSLGDLIENASISAIDQDGGELYTVGLSEVPEAVRNEAFDVIDRVFRKASA